jgi:hypothetical protein
MRRFDSRLCSAFCAALLLGGTAAWPAVALASTGVIPSTTLDQLSGIMGGPSLGYKGFSPGEQGVMAEPHPDGGWARGGATNEEPGVQGRGCRARRTTPADRPSAAV